jgi:hypothetical protein
MSVVVDDVGVGAALEQRLDALYVIPGDREHQSCTLEGVVHVDHVLLFAVVQEESQTGGVSVLGAVVDRRHPVDAVPEGHLGAEPEQNVDALDVALARRQDQGGQPLFGLQIDVVVVTQYCTHDIDVAQFGLKSDIPKSYQPKFLGNFSLPTVDRSRTARCSGVTSGMSACWKIVEFSMTPKSRLTPAMLPPAIA